MAKNRFFSAMRDETRREIEQLGSVDIVVGIPCYFSEESVAHVIKMAAAGLHHHFSGMRALVFTSDGGSTDDTRETIADVDLHYPNVYKVSSIYRGIPGKGSAMREILEAGVFLKAKAILFFDSDLKSINPEWVQNLAGPVFAGYDFVAPQYRRYKFDGTITNTIVYNLTRALFGARIRQPIGGDFAVSRKLAKHYLDQDVWETDVARFGIDIWMTITAVTGGFLACQARLGAKVHGEKDPAADLSGMFRQVVGTIFQLMEQHENFWKRAHPEIEIPSFGSFVGAEVHAFDIDEAALIEYFKVGYQNFAGVWERLIGADDFAAVKQLAESDCCPLRLSDEVWVRIVYDYACVLRSTPVQRFKLLNTMVPLYYGRVASLVHALKDRDGDGAEAYFEEQAALFEKMKPYLIEKWDGGGGS